MRRPILAGALLAALLAPQAAPAQPAMPPPPVPIADPTVSLHSWETLPDDHRAFFETRIGRIVAQSRLVVETAAKPDAATRRLSPGTVLALQRVRPGPGVVLAAAPDGKTALGAPGQALWPAATAWGDAYCRSPRPQWAVCFLDQDDDGRFEGVADRGKPMLNDSGFQIRTLGPIRPLREPVAYAAAPPSAPPAAAPEWMALRYVGPIAGVLKPDGFLRDGRVEFHILIGATPQTLHAADRLVAHLDPDGVGRLVTSGGYVVDIANVTIEGQADLRLLSALPAGGALLQPPMTRELAVRLSRAMQFPPDRR